MFSRRNGLRLDSFIGSLSSSALLSWLASGGVASPAASRTRTGAAAASGAAGGLTAGPDAEAPTEDTAQRRPGLGVLGVRLVRHALLELEVARLLAGRLRDALVDIDGHGSSSFGLLRNGAEIAFPRRR